MAHDPRKAIPSKNATSFCAKLVAARSSFLEASLAALLLLSLTTSAGEVPDREYYLGAQEGRLDELSAFVKIEQDILSARWEIFDTSIDATVRSRSIVIVARLKDIPRTYLTNPPEDMIIYPTGERSWIPSTFKVAVRSIRDNTPIPKDTKCYLNSYDSEMENKRLRGVECVNQKDLFIYSILR